MSHDRARQPAIAHLAGRSSAGRFRALGHEFTVRGDDPDLLAHVRRLLAPMARDGAAASTYELCGVDGRVTVRFCGTPIAEASEVGHAIRMLVWHVNREAVARSRHLVRLHAAAASLDGEAVLLPGAMEAGKTTLVAGLVHSGMDYLSDEVAALEPETLEVLAYPKALSIDEGSREALARLSLVPDPASTRYEPGQWQLPASAIREGAVVERSRARFVVFPSYEPGAATRMTPLSRAEAAWRLAHCTFELDRQPTRDLTAIARLLRRVDAYELRIGDLGQSCRLVRARFASASTTGTTMTSEIDPGEITLEHSPRTREDLTRVDLDGEAVVYEPDGRTVQRLNRVATVLWECFDGTASLRELSEDLAGAFGEPEERVRADVLAYARELGALGLLAGVRRSPQQAAPPEEGPPTDRPSGAP